MSKCQPSVAIKPAILKYLGKSHNLWHRSALILERIAFDNTSGNNTLKVRKDAGDQYEFEPLPPSLTLQQEAMDGLSEMYSLLKEEDLWSGLWQKKAKYQETNIAIAYEQQGYFKQAQGAYELAMTKFRNEYNGQSSPIGIQQVQTSWTYLNDKLNSWLKNLEYTSIWARQKFVPISTTAK